MPELNAALNFTSAVFLITGYVLIRRGQVRPHKFCMLSATATSAVFLVCYVYYHLHHGATRFPGNGIWKTVYFSILIPHTILAAVQVPLILRTLFLAFQNRFEAHKKLARITWPIWVYVSVTGVIIYVMLYQISWF